MSRIKPKQLEELYDKFKDYIVEIKTKQKIEWYFRKDFCDIDFYSSSVESLLVYDKVRSFIWMYQKIRMNNNLLYELYNLNDYCVWMDYETIQNTMTYIVAFIKASKNLKNEYERCLKEEEIRLKVDIMNGDFK